MAVRRRGINLTTAPLVATTTSGVSSPAVLPDPIDLSTMNPLASMTMGW